MAMATQNFRHGLPSPTLTNPDMILPDNAFDFEANVHPHPSSPSSPQTVVHAQVNSIKLADAPPSRSFASSPRTMTPTSTVHSSYSTPSRTDGSPARMKHSRSVDVMVAAHSLRSSSSQSNLNPIRPSLQASRSNSSDSVHTRNTDMRHQTRTPEELSQRTRSQELVDMKEEDEQEQEQEMTPRKPVANNVMAHEEEEEEDVLGALPKVTKADDEVYNEKWLEETEDGEEEEDSHMALSKRAEMILANAKKRLNVMEGNLRGARSSLLLPSQALSNLKMQTELEAQIHAARERDRRLYGGIGHIPPRPYDNSPLTNITLGHTRGISETFTPSSLPGGAVKKIHYSQKRASSALGPTRGAWLPGDPPSFTRTGSIRASRSQEQMRLERLASWQSASDNHAAKRLSPDPKVSPTNLDPLPEEEAFPGAGFQRSASTTGDLRSQMSELKGRISSLRERAKEDGLKRRSLQSLRTPSPFTAAEIWYSSADGYKAGPVSADAGVGLKGESSPVVGQDAARSPPPPNEALPSSPTRPHDERDSSYRQSEERHPGPIENGLEETTRTGSVQQTDGAQDHRPITEEFITKETENVHEDDDNDELRENELQQRYLEDPDSYVEQQHEEEQEEDENYNYDGFGADNEVESNSEAESIYEDASWEPVAERHEDRADAFDYENFFLHSAMGTYIADRRDSMSSDESVETTRPVSPFQDSHETRDQRSPESRPYHQRNMSVDSISTVQTFATATEGRGSRTPGLEYDDESNEALDKVTTRIMQSQTTSPALIPPAPPLPQRLSSLKGRSSSAADRADSAIHISDRQHHGSTRATSKSIPDMLVAILTSRPQNQQGPALLEDQDMLLLHSLADSLEAVCSGLQTTAVDAYDRRIWRRRLDDARRMLDGEGEAEGDAEAF